MKVICEKDYLKRTAALSEKVSGHNPTFPILDSVLISAETDNSLFFLSTDLEIGLKISIPAKVEKKGKVAVPAKLFSSFLSSLLKTGHVKLSAIKDNLMLITENTSTTIKGYPSTDFPILPKVNLKKAKDFTVSSIDFLEGLKAVCYAVSLSEMRPELNSIFVSFTKIKGLIFVATDSFRLSEKKISYDFSDDFSFLVPYKSAIEIIRIFEDRNEKIKIILDENNLFLVSGSISFVSRLTEGNFPEYEELIPVKFSNTIVVNRREVVEALKTSTMFSNKMSEIDFKIYENENFFEFQSNNPDIGEHVSKVFGKVEGNDLVIKFNHRYLFDCLQAIKSEDVVFKFAGDGKPLLIVGLEDNSFRSLMMPIRNL